MKPRTCWTILIGCCVVFVLTPLAGQWAEIEGPAWLQRENGPAAIVAAVSACTLLGIACFLTGVYMTSSDYNQDKRDGQ